jgi:hypothetical protein
MALLQPTEFFRRLATLVPPPRAHLIRYHGVFAPASRWRSHVIPLLRECTPSTPPCASAAPSEDPAPAATGTPPGQATAEVRRPADSSRIPWAELLMRRLPRGRARLPLRRPPRRPRLPHPARAGEGHPRPSRAAVHRATSRARPLHRWTGRGDLAGRRARAAAVAALTADTGPLSFPTP